MHTPADRRAHVLLHVVGRWHFVVSRDAQSHRAISQAQAGMSSLTRRLDKDESHHHQLSSAFASRVSDGRRRNSITHLPRRRASLSFSRRSCTRMEEEQVDGVEGMERTVRRSSLNEQNRLKRNRIAKRRVFTLYSILMSSPNESTFVGLRQSPSEGMEAAE